MLFIDVESADIIAARARSGTAEHHNWHNPIAIALERKHGGKAVVTKSSVYSTRFGGEAFPLAEAALKFLHDFHHGVALPVERLQVA